MTGEAILTVVEPGVPAIVFMMVAPGGRFSTVDEGGIF